MVGLGVFVRVGVHWRRLLFEHLIHVFVSITFHIEVKMKNIFWLLMGLFFPMALFSQSFSPDNYSWYSSYDYQQTIERLKRAFQEKGMVLFAEIDHKAHAQKEGLELAQATVLLVGNPKVGTPLMQGNIEIAIELPLKILVFEQKASKHIFVNFKRVSPLAGMYHSPDVTKTTEVLKRIDTLMVQLIEQALPIRYECL